MGERYKLKCAHRYRDTLKGHTFIYEQRANLKLKKDCPCVHAMTHPDGPVHAGTVTPCPVASARAPSSGTRIPRTYSDDPRDR